MINLPSVSKTKLSNIKIYGSLDIISNTIDRYFDYKRDTKFIEHKTQKVKEEAKIIVNKIYVELQRSLDNNEKGFQKEMKRLKAISKELKGGVKSRSEIFKQIDKYVAMLSDVETPMEIKSMIPVLIQNTYGQLNNENNLALKKLNLMSNFESNAKLIGGE